LTRKHGDAGTRRGSMGAINPSPNPSPHPHPSPSPSPAKFVIAHHAIGVMRSDLTSPKAVKALPQRAAEKILELGESSTPTKAKFFTTEKIGDSLRKPEI